MNVVLKWLSIQKGCYILMKFDIKNSYKFNNYNKNIIFLVIIFDNILIKYF